MVQIILSVIAILVIVLIVFIMWRIRKNERPETSYNSRVTIESLGEICSQELAEDVREDDNVNKDILYEANAHRKKKLAEALDEAPYGVEKSINRVKAAIRQIIERELPTEKDCCDVVDFTDIYYLDPVQQWEILIYMVKKTHKTDTMNYLTTKYQLHVEKEVQNEITG